MDIQAIKREAHALSHPKSPILIKPQQPGQNASWDNSSGNGTAARKGGLEHESGSYVTAERMDDLVRKVSVFPNTDFYDDQIESRPKSTHDTPK